MNKFYVTEDVAEKLRAKGYYREYDVTDEWVEGAFYQVEDGTFHLPRIDEVLAWLREEKNLYVEVLISMRGGWYNIIYEIAPRRGFDLKHMLIEKKSYEEAAIAGIEFVIDNLI